MNIDDHQSTFDRWLKDYRGLLFKVVRVYASGGTDQDDLFQEIAVAIWKSIPRFRGDSSETTWVYRVALYTAITWLRKEKRQRKQGLDDIAHVLVAAPDETPDPRLEWLYEQIRQLDVVDRSVTLLMLDGLSYHDIAETLGISENHVGVKLHRIKKKLAARAAEDQHGF